MSKSTPSRAKRKPAKPYSDYPLYAHATGRWAKRIKGKIHYFGPRGDPDGALQKYLDEKDDLHAGRKPRVRGDGPTVADAVNHFLTHKQSLRDSGELAPRTFHRYYRSCELLVRVFGKNRPVSDLAADDFQSLRSHMATPWGPVALGNEIQMARSVFKHAYDAGLIGQPVRFGPGFRKPSNKVLRETRMANGPRMFSADQISTALEHAGPQMRAMILLGINAGLGNTDLGLLPTKAVNLKTGWLEYPRAKTAIPRRIPLWPETVAAIRAVKQAVPECLVATDVCCCEYTDHGHCGVLSETTGRVDVDNDPTLKLLADQAVVHARAGADLVAPSGMMDGMIGAIRQGLDASHFSHVPIMSYAVKYASSFYGPFRDAAESTPQFGDRRSYQMDPFAAAAQAIREVELDLAEGADMLMVKPALAYLDIISLVRQRFPGVPLAAYNVSGEFSMVKAAAERGWIDEKAVAMESLLAMKRAGAGILLTYWAKDVARWLA